MVSVNFKGSPVSLQGSPPGEGDVAPDFRFVKSDLSEARLYDFSSKCKVIMSVPSLDTGVCQAQTRVFNEKLANKPDTLGIVVSQDLPFAMNRFCETEGLKNVVNASDFRYREFISEYQLEITEGALKGLSARAVLITNAEHQIVYSELVPEITQEPNYDRALSALEEAASS